MLNQLPAEMLLRILRHVCEDAAPVLFLVLTRVSRDMHRFILVHRRSLFPVYERWHRAMVIMSTFVVFNTVIRRQDYDLALVAFVQHNNITFARQHIQQWKDHYPRIDLAGRHTMIAVATGLALSASDEQVEMAVQHLIIDDSDCQYVIKYAVRACEARVFAFPGKKRHFVSLERIVKLLTARCRNNNMQVAMADVLTQRELISRNMVCSWDMPSAQIVINQWRMEALKMLSKVIASLDDVASLKKIWRLGYRPTHKHLITAISFGAVNALEHLLGEFDLCAHLKSNDRAHNDAILKRLTKALFVNKSIDRETMNRLLDLFATHIVTAIRRANGGDNLPVVSKIYKQEWRVKPSWSITEQFLLGDSSFQFDAWRPNDCNRPTPPHFRQHIEHNRGTFVASSFVVLLQRREGLFALHCDELQESLVESKRYDLNLEFILAVTQPSDFYPTLKAHKKTIYKWIRGSSKWIRRAADSHSGNPTSREIILEGYLRLLCKANDVTQGDLDVVIRMAFRVGCMDVINMICATFPLQVDASLRRYVFRHAALLRDFLSHRGKRRAIIGDIGFHDLHKIISLCGHDADITCRAISWHQKKSTISDHDNIDDSNNRTVKMTESDILLTASTTESSRTHARLLKTLIHKKKYKTKFPQRLLDALCHQGHKKLARHIITEYAHSHKLCITRQHARLLNANKIPCHVQIIK